MTKDTLSPEFFDCLPPLSELPSEAEQCDSTLRIDPSSFLDETYCSVPDLEEIPNPDSTEIPSFRPKFLAFKLVIPRDNFSCNGSL